MLPNAIWRLLACLARPAAKLDIWYKLFKIVKLTLLHPPGSLTKRALEQLVHGTDGIVSYLLAIGAEFARIFIAEMFTFEAGIAIVVLITMRAERYSDQDQVGSILPMEGFEPTRREKIARMMKRLFG